MTNRMNRRTVLSAAALSLALSTVTLPANAQDVTITFQVDSAPLNVTIAEQLIADFEATNPGINVELETRPQGADGDNLVKTRLATGDMSDVFSYNSGSLFQALNPTQTLLDLTREPWQADVLDSFKQVVTATDGTQRGAPRGAAASAGILYYKPIYAELGLSVPKTWDEFMANNEKIKAAGKVPVIQTFGATWTSQIFVLADYYNVQAEVPTFAADYTAGKAKYATTPAALRGFEYGEQVFKGGYLNDDFAAATFEEGLAKIATGEGAHYPMFAHTVTTLDPAEAVNIGYFPIPPADASKPVGATAWMPDGLYIPQKSAHIEEAKKFVAFVASVPGCDSQTKAGGATGPYLVKGCTLPTDVLPAVSDLLAYFSADGGTAPALEFISPIKGPALEQITVEVGSGIRSAADGAALYDEDVKKQAQQLGLPGWN